MNRIEIDGVIRVFDWISHHDDRSRNYPIRMMVDGKSPKSKTWKCGVVLDQGQEGSCTGHAVSHEAAAAPVIVPGITHEIAVEVFSSDAEDSRLASERGVRARRNDA